MKDNTDAMRKIFELAHSNAIAKGWWEKENIKDPNAIGAKIALIHAEASEALEEVRKGEGFYAMYSTEENPDKPEGLVVELADVIIRSADLCGALGLDLAGAIEAKMKYNASRPHRHGGKAL